MIENTPRRSGLKESAKSQLPCEKKACYTQIEASLLSDGLKIANKKRSLPLQKQFYFEAHLKT